MALIKSYGPKVHLDIDINSLIYLLFERPEK